MPAELTHCRWIDRAFMTALIQMNEIRFNPDHIGFAD
jgi:hypothetical protein